MHIAIFESTLSGHHLNYLSHLAFLFLRQGHRVSVTLLENQHIDQTILQIIFEFPDRFKLIYMRESSLLRRVTGRMGVVGTELRHWLTFRHAFKTLNAVNKIDHAFFPYLDYCLYACGLLGSPVVKTPWSGICMRPSFHYQAMGVIAPKPKWSFAKERLFFNLLKQLNVRTIFTIDELLEQYVHRSEPAIAHRIRYVPDPAELSDKFDQGSAREFFNLPINEFVILVYGTIDNRKGIDLLLNGLRGQSFSRKVKVLVVGRHTPTLSEQLNQEVLVASVNNYVGGDTEEAAFRAADAVWVGYRSHYSMSGVLVLSAVARKPVLATRNGLIGWMTEKNDLGVAIDCEDPAQVNLAVRSLINQAPLRVKMGMGGIQQRHSWSEFNQIILKGSKSEPGHWDELTI